MLEIKSQHLTWVWPYFYFIDLLHWDFSLTTLAWKIHEGVGMYQPKRANIYIMTTVLIF